MNHATHRRTQRDPSFSADKIKEWRRRIGNIPDAVVIKTLQNSTQFVDSIEAETRSTPRQHFLCRLPMLRLRRLNEGFFTDEKDDEEAAGEASPEVDPAVGGAEEGGGQVETEQPTTKKHHSSAPVDPEGRMPGQLPTAE